jgi:hypothetical protein
VVVIELLIFNKIALLAQDTEFTLECQKFVCLQLILTIYNVSPCTKPFHCHRDGLAVPFIFGVFAIWTALAVSIIIIVIIIS